MIAAELERALHDAFVNAREARHEYIGVEHLLLAIIETPTAAQVLRGCGAQFDTLRGKLIASIATHTTVRAEDEVFDTQPTLGFQRAIQRAILHAQSKGKKEVGGVDVLLAILKEADSHAARFLKQQRIDWLRVATFVSQGTAELMEQQRELNDPSREEPTRSSDVQVVLYNDDFTPMEMVVGVLERFFGMNRDDATEVMLEVHRQGVAVCGLYAREAGEELAAQVRSYALERGYPLRCATITPKPTS